MEKRGEEEDNLIKKIENIIRNKQHKKLWRKEGEKVENKK
jgi:hypothetical protein